jgi:hypothetical protein
MERLKFWTVKASMMDAMNLQFRPRPTLHNYILDRLTFAGRVRWTNV